MLTHLGQLPNYNQCSKRGNLNLVTNHTQKQDRKENSVNTETEYEQTG